MLWQSQNIDSIDLSFFAILPVFAADLCRTLPSAEHRLDIHAALPPDIVEMRVQKPRAGRAPGLLEKTERIGGRYQLGCNGEFTHQRVIRDHVHEHMLHRSRFQRAGVELPLGKADRAQLPQQ